MLHFAAKDADDFEALAKSQEGGLYEKVITHSDSSRRQKQQEKRFSMNLTGSRRRSAIPMMWP